MRLLARARSAHPLFLCVVVLALLFWGAAATAQDVPRPDWSKAQAIPVVEGLSAPSNFVFAPDGSIWFTEVFKGDVSRLDPVTGKKSLAFHVNSVALGDERGLLGLALDPGFAANGAFYLYYTQPTANVSAGLNKLVRVQDGTETLLVALPAAEQHNGGRILIVPDGTMFVSTGDNLLRDPAQDPKSLLGKILHMTTTGTPVVGNLDGLVYSRGHRNVYGLAYDDGADQLWATENSGWRRDEINLIRARGNYGYPECEGLGLNGVGTPCPEGKGYTKPIMTFYENRTAAPVGATFWRGELYWISLNEGSIHHLWNEGGAWRDEIVYDTPEPLLDLRVSGPDLYFSSFEGIYRLDFGEPRNPEVQQDRVRPNRGIPAPGVALLLFSLALVMLASRRGGG